MAVAVFLWMLVLVAVGAHGVSWKPAMCRQGREEGNSIVLEARCVPEGIEVTWTSLNPDVDWVQVEFHCRNVSSEEEEFEERRILQQLSSTISGSNVILLPSNSTFQTECSISGCYKEGWFERYSIAPAVQTCPQTVQSTYDPIEGLPVQAEPGDITATATLNLYSSSSLEATPSQTYSPSTTPTPPAAAPPTPTTSHDHSTTPILSSVTGNTISQATSSPSRPTDPHSMFTHAPTSTTLHVLFSAPTSTTLHVLLSAPTSTTLHALLPTTKTVTPGNAHSTVLRPVSSLIASPSQTPAGFGVTDGVRSRLVVTVSTVAFLCLVSCVIILVVVVAFLAMRRQLQASGAHLSLPTKGGQELEQGLMPTPTTTEPKTADY